MTSTHRPRIPGPQRDRIERAIREHFDDAELSRLVAFLGQRYRDYVGPGLGLEEAVHRVVEVAHRRGWLFDLLEQAARERQGPQFPFRQIIEHLTKLRPDHLVVLVADTPGGELIAADARRRLADLPVTLQPWPSGDGPPDQARAVIDASDVVIVAMVAAHGWLCRYVLDRAAATASDVVALLARDDMADTLPSHVTTIRITGGTSEGWDELERHLDLLASPEGLLRALHARRDRLAALLAGAGGEQPRYEAEIRDVESRIDLQQRRVRDPVGARRDSLEVIEQTRRQEREPDQPRAMATRIPTVNAPPPEPPAFQDRDDERILVEQSLLDPAVRLVALTGRDGVGKTGLVSRLWNSLFNPDTPVAVDGLAYLPVHGFLPVTPMALLRALLWALPGDAANRLDERLRLPVPLVEKVDEVLAELGDRTVVVVIDNVEALLDDAGALRDPGLQGLVSHLVRHPVPAVRLVLVSQRPPAHLLGSLPEHAIRAEPLRGLQRDEAHRLLCALDTEEVFAFEGASDHEKDRLHRLTGGTPRALELAYAVLRSRPEATLARLLDEIDQRAGSDVVRFLFDEIFRELTRDQQRVVQALAAYARPVEAGAVDDLLQYYLGGTASRTLLESLHERRFIRRDGNRYYLPYHPDGWWVLQQLPPGGPEDREPPYRLTRTALWYLAAEHFAGVRKPEDAVTDIGDLAARFDEIDLRIRGGEYDLAQELIEDLDTGYLNRWGYSDATIPMLDDLAPDVAGDRNRTVRLLSRLAEAHRQRERAEQSIACIDRAVTLLRWRDADPRAVLDIQRGAALADLGRLSEATASYRRAWWRSIWFNDDEQTAAVHSGLMSCLGRAGRFAAALRHRDRAVRLLRGHAETALAVGSRLRLNACWIQSQLGRHGPAWEELWAALAMSGDLHHHLIRGRALVLQAQLLLDEGGYAAAVEVAEIAADLGVQADNGRLCRAAKEILTLARLCVDDLNGAAEAVDVPGRSNGDLLGLGLRGIVAYRRGDSGTARAAFEVADAQARARRVTEARDFQVLDWHGLVLTGWALVDRDQRDRHLAAAEEAFYGARRLAPDGHGAVLRTMQLLNQMAFDADPALVDRVRAAAGGITGS
ncbi:effector-associated domain EAD1-containing protein [Paractinoplanes rishiriensis]|uniref:Effector-associated domain-containing protein n=1 Tax=Paractinoplanes rishiriensis TaxID=1050105 RepID=A0A919KB70_9ACTN|nr:effector-associated domain EAD1-containing protein [Actinoplanes rishiriensis]GIF02125.1 hypothetical protein Ari01nite_95890 [Actinoplanes rishiriensis]